MSPKSFPGSLSGRLRKALRPDRLAALQAVAEAASARGVSASLVGGAVRDLLLGRRLGDLDVVVETNAVTLGRGLARQHGGRLVPHSAFLTARWWLEGSAFSGIAGLPFVDLITARTERYARPAALPTIAPASLADDLLRRDFSINTLAIRIDGGEFGRLIDAAGGLDDLRQGRIRVLHPHSFVDDPTRILRAVRYEQRYAFTIERPSLRHLKAALPLIARLSDQRIRHELDLLLDEPGAVAALARLHALGVLGAISNALPWSAADQRRLAPLFGKGLPRAWGLESPGAGVPAARAIAYAVWLGGGGMTSAVRLVQSRLGFPSALLHIIMETGRLVKELPDLAGARPSRWVERLERVPPPAVYAAYLSVPPREGKPLRDYALRWRKVHPATDGHALQKLGLPPSSAYREILSRLRAARLDGQIKSDADETVLLRSLLARG